MRNRLRLTFLDDGDGSGELSVLAENEEFAGSSAAYFSTRQLERFAELIRQYPLPDRRIGIAGGFLAQGGDGLDQELVALDVYPIGSRGQIGIQVRTATEIWDPEEADKRQMAQLELTASYEGLKRLSANLRGLVRGELKVVDLDGDDLGAID